jgi:hypothetical protein
MNPGSPDSEPVATPPRSLAGRLLDAVRAPHGDAPRERSWGLALAVTVLLAAGPVLTIGGAELLTRSARAQAAALREQQAPRAAAEAQRAAARDMLAPVVARPSLGATLEAVARVLPGDVTLTRAERTGSGALELDFAAPDPDRVRQALRRSPELARLRNVGQRQGDGGMIVAFRAEGP